MSRELLLYILIFVARIAVSTHVWVKYGRKAFGWMILYTVLTTISDCLGVIV